MSDADRAVVARVSAGLLDAVNRSHADGIAAVWAEDGVMMPPGKPAVRGRPAIEAYFRALFSTARFHFRFTASDIQVVGDLASERLTYTADAWLDGASKPAQTRGKGIHLFRRLPDGDWALAMDMWDSELTR